MNDNFDVIVVGAGSAGAVVAARLSERTALNVLLLEAGPEDKAMEVHIPAAFSKLFRGPLDWNYDTAPQAELRGRSVFWPRGRTLGGSSSLNAMMWVEGFAADYDEWGKLAGPQWSWESLQTELATVRESIGGQPQRSPRRLTSAFLDAVREAGIPVEEANTPEPAGFTATQVSQRRGARWSTADAYLRPAKDRANLTVRTEALVRKVSFDGTRATGVEYEVDGHIRTATAREVVLSGGAVNTPQLLKLSGIGPADELRRFGIDVVADRTEVGSGMRDHLVCAHLVETTAQTLDEAESPAQLAAYLLRRRGMLTSNVAEAYGFVRTDPSLDHPDIELIFAPVGFVDEGLAPAPAPALTLGPILLRPLSHGTVTLSSADPHAKPVIDPRYLTDPADMEAMIQGMLIAENILAQPSIAPLLTGRYVSPLGAERLEGRRRAEHIIRSGAHTLYHPTSTARMGSDDDAVVDPDLLVRGVQGLSVADASVFPEIIRGHTHAPALIVGERAASLVAERLR